MNKTNENLVGVIDRTILARKHNPQIGYYFKHYFNQNFDYAIVLSDKGAFTISRALAQDFIIDPTNISDPRINQEANSYRNIH